MGHRRSTFRRGISQSQRRKKSWIQVSGPAVGTDDVIGSDLTPNMNISVPAGPAASVGFPSASSAGLFSDPFSDKIPEESTILRLRGSLNLPKNDVITQGTNNYAIGIGVMEAGAAALGAFPNPATVDGGAWDGWMFYRSQQAGSLDANAAIIDVKSMRKVQSGMAIIIVVGGVHTVTSSTSGLIAFQAQINLRALILLP